MSIKRCYKNYQLLPDFFQKQGNKAAARTFALVEKQQESCNRKITVQNVENQMTQEYFRLRQITHQAIHGIHLWKVETRTQKIENIRRYSFTTINRTTTSRLGQKNIIFTVDTTNHIIVTENYVCNDLHTNFLKHLCIIKRYEIIGLKITSTDHLQTLLESIQITP